MSICVKPNNTGCNNVFMDRFMGCCACVHSVFHLDSMGNVWSFVVLYIVEFVNAKDAIF